MALLDDIKLLLRVDEPDCDGEIGDLIDSAKREMESKGLDKSKIVDTDPLIKRCIGLYCKANHGYEDVNQSERFQECYESLLNHLLLSGMYKVVV